MKKLLCLSIILTMLLALAACGSKDSSSSSSSSEAAAETTQAQTQKPTAAATEDSATKEVTLIPGTVYFLNIEENEEPVVKGLALDGNRIGNSVTTTEDGINGMPISDENIRFVFALNEWIGIRLETTQPEDLSMYIIKRGDKPNVYTAPFEPDAYEGCVQAKLQAPEDPTKVDATWGEAYVNPDDSDPGDYDLVITSGKKPVAQVVIKLYNEADLEGKTDAELKQLMEGEVTAAKAKQG